MYQVYIKCQYCGEISYGQSGTLVLCTCAEAVANSRRTKVIKTDKRKARKVKTYHG